MLPSAAGRSRPRCLCWVLPVRLGQPGAAERGDLQRWGQTCLATATCPCKQTGDCKGDAGSSPPLELHAIRVLTSPHGAKMPGSPVPWALWSQCPPPARP